MVDNIENSFDSINNSIVTKLVRELYCYKTKFKSKLESPKLHKIETSNGFIKLKNNQYFNAKNSKEIKKIVKFT